MDGKVQALDVANDGRLVWQSDLDGAALLGGNLGKMEVRARSFLNIGYQKNLEPYPKST